MNIVTEKVCKKCGKKKPKDSFYSHSAQCKDCVGEIYKENRESELLYAKNYGKKNKEKLKEYIKSWYKKNREKVIAYNRKRYQTKKDHISKKSKQRYEENKEVVIAKALLWQKNNPDKVRARNRNRRAREAGGTVSAEDWTMIKEKYGNRCLCCGSEKNIEMDHIIPLACGGIHTPDNIQPLCKSCNCRKHTQTIDYRPKEMR